MRSRFDLDISYPPTRVLWLLILVSSLVVAVTQAVGQPA